MEKQTTHDIEKVKLRTLKDICRRGYIDFDKEEKNGTYAHMCKFNELKQEAIGWIKHIKNDITQVQDLQFESMYGNIMKRLAVKDLDEILEAQITWIKMFFNITEEELNTTNG